MQNRFVCNSHIASNNRIIDWTYIIITVLILIKRQSPCTNCSWAGFPISVQRFCWLRRTNIELDPKSRCKSCIWLIAIFCNKNWRKKQNTSILFRQKTCKQKGTNWLGVNWVHAENILRNYIVNSRVKNPFNCSSYMYVDSVLKYIIYTIRLYDMYYILLRQDPFTKGSWGGYKLFERFFVDFNNFYFESDPKTGWKWKLWYIAIFCNKN